jgi:BASS family bile acid:Na+ symporter
MLEIILFPILISRLLLWKIYTSVQKIRGKVVIWGFALIIYTVVGLNRQAIFSDLNIVLKISTIFAIALFVVGTSYEFAFRKKIQRDKRIVQNLMLTIKSSGFSAGTALSLFGKESALVPAIMAVFVVSYLIFVGFLFEKKYKLSITY